jgi:hypothetical protein
MMTRTNVTLATMIAIVAGAAIVAPVLAGGDKVTFPADFEKGVNYFTFDRADNKQVRMYYTSQAAIDAAKKGEPLPANTVITMIQYAAQLGADGNPVKDANGRFIKTNIVGYTAMEKRSGWGAEYPENVRNGEWEYQAFRPDKTPNPTANLTNCFNCHKPLGEKVDFVYTYDKLQAAAK